MARPPIEADAWTRLRIAELAQTIAFERQIWLVSLPQIGEILSQSHSTVVAAIKKWKQHNE